MLPGNDNKPSENKHWKYVAIALAVILGTGALVPAAFATHRPGPAEIWQAIDNLQAQIDQLFDNDADLQQQIDGLEAENADLQEQIDALEARIDALEEQDGDGDGNGGGTTQCNDGLDNDSDGLVDLADPGCPDASGNNESSIATACADGIDNDGDGLTDTSDPACSSATDTSEEPPNCDDGNPETDDSFVPGTGCVYTTNPSNVDGDEDGFLAAEDCDDSNASVNPDATETANGIDDDCDGQVDEGTTTITADAYEPNNVDTARADLGSIRDNGLPAVFSANFHTTTDDHDWYQFTAIEDTNNTCFPGTDERYETRVAISDIPSGSNYDLDVYADSISGALRSSANSGSDDEFVEFVWFGECGADDEKAFIIDVINTSGTASEQSYALTIIHTFVGEA